MSTSPTPADLDHLQSCVDDDAFRGALARFASGVTVISTVASSEAGDIDHAMTASAFTSVSLNPRLVLMCSHKINRFHDAVIASKVWGVSILAEEGKAASAWFAKRGRPLDDQFGHYANHRGVTGVPLLDEALGWLECRTWSLTDAGDHSVIIGEVVAAHVKSESFDDPLLYYRSHYGTLVRLPESEKTVEKES